MYEIFNKVLKDTIRKKDYKSYIEYTFLLEDRITENERTKIIFFKDRSYIEINNLQKNKNIYHDIETIYEFDFFVKMLAFHYGYKHITDYHIVNSGFICSITQHESNKISIYYEDSNNKGNNVIFNFYYTTNLTQIVIFKNDLKIYSEFIDFSDIKIVKNTLREINFI